MKTRRTRKNTEKLTLTLERETDGRWLAWAHELPGVAAYGKSRKAALTRCLEVALACERALCAFRSA